MQPNKEITAFEIMMQARRRMLKKTPAHIIAGMRTNPNETLSRARMQMNIRKNSAERLQAWLAADEKEITHEFYKKNPACKSIIEEEMEILRAEINRKKKPEEGSGQNVPVLRTEI